MTLQSFLGILQIAWKILFWILSILLFCDCREDLRFLSNYWARPLTDPYPAENVHPANCGGCHRTQYEAYQGSLHAKTMGSGVLWQLLGMNETERENCYSCHSPFPIQQTSWNQILASLDPWIPTSKTFGDSDAHFMGVTCATCHIRGENFYGPPLSGNVTKDYQGTRPHTLEIRTEFLDEAFCITCHTTARGGKKVNGKYLMDIYEDWKSTKFSKRGENFRTCQSCHMPEREHTWKGIHSKDFVEKAIQINWDSSNESLTISNEGVGHTFPAYSVPRIEILLLDEWGNELYRKELGWKLDIFLEKEIEDSRIASGESRRIPIPISELLYSSKDPKNKLGKKRDTWKIQVFIHPRSHYSDSFHYTLKNLSLTDWEISELKKAIQFVENSRYLLWEKKLRLNGYSKSRLE